MSEGAKRRGGRPTDYTPELADKICDELASGKSLHRVCQAPNMPDKATVFRWLARYPEFRDKYDVACAERHRARYERIDEVIEDMRAGVIDAACAKVEIDALKWMLAREAPRKYGDRLAMDHGVQPDNPLADMLSAIAGRALRPDGGQSD